MSSSELENGWILVEKDSNQPLAKIEPPRPRVPLGITRKELIVVHLTAKTVAYNGIHFEQELMSRVSVNPEFESLFRFLNPTDSMRGFYDEVTLVYAYASSLPPPPYSEYTSGRVSTATVFEVFFNGVRLYLDLDQGEEMDFPYLLETDWSALDPQGRGLSLLSKMIQTAVQIWTNMWELGQTLINLVKGV